MLAGKFLFFSEFFDYSEIDLILSGVYRFNGDIGFACEGDELFWYDLIGIFELMKECNTFPFYFEIFEMLSLIRGESE